MFRLMPYTSSNVSSTKSGKCIAGLLTVHDRTREWVGSGSLQKLTSRAAAGGFRNITGRAESLRPDATRPASFLSSYPCVYIPFWATKNGGGFRRSSGAVRLASCSPPVSGGISSRASSCARMLLLLLLLLLSSSSSSSFCLFVFSL